MSLFNQDIAQKADKWAFEELYKVIDYITDRGNMPYLIIRKSDGADYRTLRSLWMDYLYECKRKDSIERLLNKNQLKRYHDIKLFKNYMYNNCTDTINYQGEIYFRYNWFYEEFISDIYNHYFEI